VVIGAGPAGESAAELAAFLGRSVVILRRINQVEWSLRPVSAPPQLVVEKITERTIRVAELLQDLTALNNSY
jgi:thioredoxin reductase